MGIWSRVKSVFGKKELTQGLKRKKVYEPPKGPKEYYNAKHLQVVPVQGLTKEKKRLAAIDEVLEYVKIIRQLIIKFKDKEFNEFIEEKKINMYIFRPVLVKLVNKKVCDLHIKYLKKMNRNFRFIATNQNEMKEYLNKTRAWWKNQKAVNEVPRFRDHRKDFEYFKNRAKSLSDNALKDINITIANLEKDLAKSSARIKKAA